MKNMYTTIYRPKSIEDFVGNKEAIQSLTQWLSSWTVANKPVLISGICGIGKSLMVDLLLSTYNLKSIEVDEDRDKDYMENHIKSFTQTAKNIYGKQNVLVVNDIDSGCDHGFISYLTDCIKSTKIPIICICNNRYDMSIKPITNYCIDIKMVKPSYQEIYKFLYKIVQIEKLNVDIKQIYEQSNGDIRFMLNTLQCNHKTKNKKDVQNNNIFETTGNLFWMNDPIDKKYDTYWLSKDLHTLMVQENYIANIFGVKEPMSLVSYSADALSDTDLFDKKLYDTQQFELEPYIAYRTIDATTKCNKRSMIKFTQFLGKLSIANKNKKMEKIKFKTQEPIVIKTVPTKIIAKIKTKDIPNIIIPNETKEPKRRGRPKKIDKDVEKVKRPRGRPKKNGK